MDKVQLCQRQQNSCQIGPAGSSIGHPKIFTAPVQGRLAALEEVSLLPGDDGAEVESTHQGAGFEIIGSGQAQDADTGSCDAQAAPSRLRRPQIGQSLRCQL